MYYRRTVHGPYEALPTNSDNHDFCLLAWDPHEIFSFQYYWPRGTSQIITKKQTHQSAMPPNIPGTVSELQIKTPMGMFQLPTF